MSNAVHLGRRFVSSLSRREPGVADVAWVDSHLLAGERDLWQRMSAADRRHSITVARRFEALGPWSRDEMAAALLHDVGKIDSGLGTCGRVVATIVGPRTARFRRYHDHETIGADMLAAAGSTDVTVELVRGHGRAAAALRDADDV
jgi:predicted HD phosphohydrolase